MSARGDAEFDRWKSWIETITKDLASLRANQQRWRDYAGMVEANRLIQTPAGFDGWLGDLYATTQAVGIRRQADEDGRSVSLARLLSHMADNAEVLTRERFLSERPSEWREEADGWFDDVVGRGDALDPAIPRGELQALKDKVERIRRYVNKEARSPGPASLPGVPDVGRPR